MKRVILCLSMLAALGSLVAAADRAPPPPVAPVPDLPFGKVPPVVVQIGPTSSYSTINCAAFVKLPDGAWKSTTSDKFGLGFVQGIVPPVRPIRAGAYIYNNIDLYSQLEEQCAATLVRARY